jgi:hypothetical protein
VNIHSGCGGRWQPYNACFHRTCNNHNHCNRRVVFICTTCKARYTRRKRQPDLKTVRLTRAERRLLLDLLSKAGTPEAEMVAEKLR